MEVGMAEAARAAAGPHVRFGHVRGTYAVLFLLSSDLLRGERPHAGNALLDVAELCAVSAIIRSSGQSGHLSRNRFSAIAWIRMIAEELRPPRPAFFLQLGEKLGHGMRIEAGVVHNVGAQQIRFSLRLPRIL